MILVPDTIRPGMELRVHFTKLSYIRSFNLISKIYNGAGDVVANNKANIRPGRMLPKRKGYSRQAIN